MAEREGMNEELKAANQMEWVQRMNSIQNRAEEVIKAELIFAYCRRGRYRITWYLPLLCLQTIAIN